MRKVWIEAALNGPWGRALQPGIPDTVEAIIAEGIACARAGAATVHVHAYDGGGPQTFDWQVYARIIEGIRAAIDVPVYPSYPAVMTTGLDGSLVLADAASRFAHVEALAARGLLEFAAVDPGSVNFTLAAPASTARPASIYLNPEAHIRHALDVAARNNLHPAFAIYEPGFTRAGAALARAAGSGSRRGAMDDFGAWRRCPPADRRGRGTRRPCAGWPRGCSSGHTDEQSRTSRRSGAHRARARRRTRNRCRDAAGACRAGLMTSDVIDFTALIFDSRISRCDPADAKET